MLIILIIDDTALEHVDSYSGSQLTAADARAPDPPEKRIDDCRRVAQSAHLAGADGRLSGQRDVAYVALVVQVREVSHLRALGKHGVVYDDLPVLEGLRLDEAAGILCGWRCHAKCLPH